MTDSEDKPNLDRVALREALADAICEAWKRHFGLPPETTTSGEARQQELDYADAVLCVLEEQGVIGCHRARGADALRRQTAVPKEAKAGTRTWAVCRYCNKDIVQSGRIWMHGYTGRVDCDILVATPKDAT